MSVSVLTGFDWLFFSCTSACLVIFVKWGRIEYQTLWILPCQVPHFCIPIKLELCSGMQLIYLETVRSFWVLLLRFVKEGQGRRQWHRTPVLLPGKSHGRRTLVGCSPWGHEESDTAETSPSCIGEGNGNPLQCSCLENPRDGEAWWAAVYGVAQSRTWLKQLSSSSRAWEMSARLVWISSLA